MYVHLGNNYIIPANKIIAILSIEPPISSDIEDIIDIARNDRKLINISNNDKQKALIICDDNVFISPISSNTLYKRAANLYKGV